MPRGLAPGRRTGHRTPRASTEEQRWLIEFRADVQAKRDEAEQAGEDTTDWDEAIAGIDAEINAAGMRGNVLRGRTAPKRSRSTRRRQDAPDLPKRARQDTTLGRTFTGSGRQDLPAVAVRHPHPALLRPGPLRTACRSTRPPTTTRAAARDALHFSKLVDRFVQNLRRVAGYDVQYFATVEPQKRLAPHLHMAIRGTMPRAEIKADRRRHLPPGVVASGRRGHASTAITCRSESRATSDGRTGRRLPRPGHRAKLLPTWDEALDQLDADEDAEPLHVLRFGAQVDVQGILAGTAGRRPVHRLPDQVPHQEPRRRPRPRRPGPAA